MVYQVEMLWRTYCDVGPSICVNSSTVCRTVAKLWETRYSRQEKLAWTAVLTEIDKIIIIQMFTYAKSNQVLRLILAPYIHF